MTKRSHSNESEPTEQSEQTPNAPKDLIKYTLDFSVKGEVILKGHHETLTDLKNAVNLLGQDLYDAFNWEEIEERKEKTFQVEIGDRKLVCTLH